MSGETFRYVLLGIQGTLVITFVSLFLGSILAVPVTLARRSKSVLLRGLSTTYIEAIRAVPPLVWLFLVFFGLPQLSSWFKFSPIAASIISFTAIASCYLAEIYRSGISALGIGQLEASRALGLPAFTTGRLVVAPQVLKVSGPSIATYGIGLLKDSALASTIGVLELAFRAGTEVQLTGKGLTLFSFIGVIYLLLSLPLAFISRWFDSRQRSTQG